MLSYFLGQAFLMRLWWILWQCYILVTRLCNAEVTLQFPRWLPLSCHGAPVVVTNVTWLVTNDPSALSCVTRHGGIAWCQVRKCHKSTKVSLSHWEENQSWIFVCKKILFSIINTIFRACPPVKCQVLPGSVAWLSLRKPELGDLSPGRDGDNTGSVHSAESQILLWNEALF